jgi:SHS2 domain-containing protein
VAHSFDDHTSETRLRLMAPTLEALLTEAALALDELVEGEPLAGAGALVRAIELGAPDRDALLVDWLNEIIFLTETCHGRLEAVTVTLEGQTALRAQVQLAPQERLRSPIKAVSFHGLEIVEGPDGFAATVILDV